MMKSKLFSWLMWLIPCAIVAYSFVLIGSDAPAFITWYFTFFLISLAFMPLSSLIFSGNADKGWAFAKPLAMAIAGFTIWTLSYLHILPFRFIPILFSVIVFFTIFLSVRKSRSAFAEAFKDVKAVRLMAFEESLFAGGLLFWSFVRGTRPLLDSLEKPMDYGFMMSMMRTDYLPAKDIWFSAGDINYYYFGQYIYTFMTKLSGLMPDITYNLSMATTLALTLSLSFALCYMLIAMSMRKGLKLLRFAPALGGIVGAFFTTFGGNSHSFFYATYHAANDSELTYAPGYKLLKFFQDKGWLAKWQPGSPDLLGTDGLPDISITDFWFANSTRFIGHNPETHDKTIHEFPYYSFLVADLHAHLINLAFVLLLLGLLAVLISSSSMNKIAAAFRHTDYELSVSDDKNWFRKELSTAIKAFRFTATNPIFLISSILLGIFMMCNFWDFAIYFVVIAMTLLTVNLRGIGKLGSIQTFPVFIFQMICVMVPFLLIPDSAFAILGFAVAVVLCFAMLLLSCDAFTVTGAQISVLFLISHIAALPFNLNFDPMSKSIAFAINHTPFYQLVMLWGTHVLIGLLFVVYIIRRRFAMKNDVSGHTVLAQGKLSRFLIGMNPVDLFVAGLFICGIIFIVMPELVYVVDIYSGDYKRANTMFKFTYQSFVMLSLVIGYCVMRIALTKPGYTKVDERWSYVAVIMVLLLAIPAYYPVISTNQWVGELKQERYKGLNGVSGLYDTDRLDAINWINNNIEGQPVLLEAYGDSYTEYCQLTAYTGLRTVIGWQTHEWLWRTSRTITDGYNQVVRPHQIDVEQIYLFTDENAVRTLIDKYKIEYISVSRLERTKFHGINEEGLKALGEIVYDKGGIYIIKVS